MEEERFVSAPQPLRTFPFTNCNNKPLPNDAVLQKPITPILDRFKSLLQEREHEVRVLAEDDVPFPNTDEIVRIYEILLSELTFNSKPIITDLTIIAGDQREHGEGIADVICARIIEAPVEQKLPSLYLLDSIVKNIGREYVRCFSARLPEVFCEAYRQVHPNLHPSMRHLFGTWSAVFPSSVLRKIEAQLQSSPSVSHQPSGLPPLRASESPRPTHGIHVNPKYLEARRQFEHSTADSNIHLGKGTSSSLKIQGKLAIGYDEYDSDNAEVISSQVGSQRLSSTGRACRTSFALEAEKLPPSSAAGIAMSSSPFGIGQARSLSPAVDEFVVDDSPGRLVERASPSHPGFGYGRGRVMGRDEEASNWRRVQWSDRTHQQFETSSAYSFSNGVELQRPRALIDAYGTDQGNRTMNHKPPKVENMDMNGVDRKVARRTWQNTEEEEFDWEDMSPTLTDMRPGFGTHPSTALETDFGRGNCSTQGQLSLVNGSSEDAVPSFGSGRGLMNKITGFHNESTKFHSSHYPQDSWNLPRNLPESSQHYFNAKGSERNFRMPFLPKSSADEQKPLIDGFRDADAQFHGSSTVATGMNSSRLESLNPAVPSAAVPESTGAWPHENMHRTHPLPLLPTFPLQKQIRSQFDSMNASYAVVDQGLNNSYLAQQQLYSIESKTLSKLPQFPHQPPGPTSLNQQSQTQIALLQPQLPMSWQVRQSLFPPAVASNPSHPAVPPLNHGYVTQGHGASMNSVLSNPIPGMQSSMPILNISNMSSHLPGGALPPLPPGPRPASSQMMAISHNPGLIAPRPPAGGALSGLFSSLVAQGLISLKQAPVQDSVGLEFNPDLLKVRHESAITALYADLPRQCKTCGLRFKCQEEHSSHMDWHVTKNRISKNRKQKPSRNWFVSVSMWLSGAEALGTDSVPGFLPTGNVVEKMADEEMAVPADEDQNVCALCGEPFDDFYSDETEEWMYKGAVYMNAPTGLTSGMDRSQLGAIVHAKCRSDSSAVSPEDFSKNEGGYTEEDSQRKRMRS